MCHFSHSVAADIITYILLPDTFLLFQYFWAPAIGVVSLGVGEKLSLGIRGPRFWL